MVSSQALNTILMLGALLIFGCSLALSYPSSDDDLMMNDDYEYHDDQSSSSQQIKPSSISAKPIVPQQNKSQSISGILGEDVVLKCGYAIQKNNVIIWYKDSQVISTGNNLLLPNFGINSTTSDLTILKSSPQSAGDYYCQVEPDHVYIHTKVVLGDHLLDIITPESSKSGQSSVHGISLLAFVLATLQLYKH